MKSSGWEKLGLCGADVHDGTRASHAWARARWMVLAGCLMAIPAFYMELLSASKAWLICGKGLYAGMAVACTGALAWTAYVSRKPMRFIDRNRFDAALACGATLSIIGGETPWPSIEWGLRLAFVAVVALRIVVALHRYVERSRIPMLLLAGLIMLLLAGVGFDWLEPKVHSYSDGLWLAFESSAAVGYGDLAPTTPASRVFAVFVVILGYGMLSLAFASLAALFVEDEERALRQEMHRDIKALRGDIAQLRQELDEMRNAVPARRAKSDDASMM